MDALKLTRQAAFAINSLCKNAGLGNLAIRWNGDDTGQFIIRDAGDIRAISHGRIVANIAISEREGISYASIHVQDCFSLIRHQHLADFDPAAYGIEVKYSYDPITKEKDIDLSVSNWPLENLPDLGPRMPPIRNVFKTKPKVIGSLTK